MKKPGGFKMLIEVCKAFMQAGLREVVIFKRDKNLSLSTGAKLVKNSLAFIEVRIIGQSENNTKNSLLSLIHNIRKIAKNEMI